MNIKKVLSVIVVLAMVMAVVPTLGLVASAEDEQVLFDIANIVSTSTGDISISSENIGLSTSDNGTTYSGQWGEDGAWNGNPKGAKALMFFRAGGRGNGSDETKTVTFDNAKDTRCASDIAISFNFATQESSDIYQTWSFVDNDGKTFARFYVDAGNSNAEISVGTDSDPYAYVAKPNKDAVLGFRGKSVEIKVAKGEGNWTVTYTMDGEEVHTETLASINGIAKIVSSVPQWNNQYAAMALQGLKVTYVVPETVKTVKATYKTSTDVNLGEVEGVYDSADASGYTFPEKYYAVDGEGVVYYTAATTLKEDDEIVLTPIDNVDVAGFAEGGKAYVDGEFYDVKSGNLIPNGDFSDGLNGWFNGTKAAATEANFTVNGDGTISAKGSNGQTGENSVYRSWPIEEGKTYVLTYTDTTGGEYHKISLASALPSGNVTDGEKVLINNGATGTVFTVFTNESYNYLRLSYRWLGTGPKFGNYGLYEVEKAEEETLPDGVEELPAITVIEGNEPVLPKTVKLTAGEEPYEGVGTVTEWTQEGDTYKGTIFAGFAGYEFPVQAEVQVNVLSCTDDTLAGEIKEYGQTNGDAKSYHALAEVVKGKASFEFDVVYHVAPGSNDFIGFGQGSIHSNKPTFKDSAFSIQGRDNNQIAVQSSTGWSENVTIELNQPYRVFFTTDTDAQTYTATITAPNGDIVLKTDELTYRDSKVTAIDGFVALYNSGSEKEKCNRATVTNLRVAWADRQDLVVTVNDAEGNKLGTYTTTGRVGDTATIPAGVYKGEAGYWYLDKATESTEITEEYTATATAAVLTMFTYNGTNVLLTDGTYNAANAVSWNKESGDARKGYALVTVPENYVAAEQDLYITYTAWLNNGTKQAATVNFYTVDYDQFAALDITDGGNVNELEETLIVENVNTAEGAEVTKTKAPDNKEYDTVTKSVKIEASELKAGETVALKFYPAAGTDGITVFSAVAIEAYTAPEAPEVELGWNDGDFTINFLTDAAQIEINGKVYDNESGKGIAVKTDATNNQITAAAVANGVAKSEAVSKSIYELVVEDIVAIKAVYTSDTVNADRVAAANKVIAKGGIYYGEDKTADVVTAQIMEVTVTDETVTAVIDADIAAFGIGFVLDGNDIYFGSEKKVEGTGTYTTLVINVADGTVTLDSVSAEAAVTLSLEAVNIEFIETLISESGAGNADAELDFIPEL